MNLLPWRNADADTKHDTIIMLAIHSLLVGMNLVLYMFGVYDVKIMMDGEAHPALTRLVLGISRTIWDNFLLPVLPGLLVFMWLDAWVFVQLRLRLGKVASAAWNILVVILLIWCACFCVWGMKWQLRSIADTYFTPR